MKPSPLRPNSSFILHPSSFPHAGFSLIELAGVMLIISILAAAIIPAVLSQLDAAARTKEAKDLNAFAAALQASILRTGYIPTATDWAAAVADEVANAPSNVSTNQRHFARAYLINPALSLAGTGLPYQQGTNGTARPANATLMIVGSTRGNLPLVSGATAFTELWNTAPGQKPATWTTYRGNGDDLLVQRINLEPLFCRLILHNLATNGQPRFKINANSNGVALAVNASARVSYYLKGTVVGLFDPNANPSSATNLQVREILRDDTHRVFDGTYWRDQLLQGSVSTTASNSSGIASQFLAADPPHDVHDNDHHHYEGKGNVTPAGVAAMLYGYMFAYTAWSSQSPCFGYDDSTDDGKGEKSSHRNMMDKVFDEFEHGAKLFDSR